MFATFDGISRCLDQFFFLLLLNLLRCYCICTAVSSLSVFIVLDSFIYLVTLHLFCLRGMISGISALSLSLSVSGFWFISHCILLLFCVFCVTFNRTLYLCILCWTLVFVITLIQYWWVWTLNKKWILFVYYFTISGSTTEAKCRMASIFVAKKTFWYLVCYWAFLNSNVCCVSSEFVYFLARLFFLASFFVGYVCPRKFSRKYFFLSIVKICSKFWRFLCCREHWCSWACVCFRVFNVVAYLLLLLLMLCNAACFVATSPGRLKYHLPALFRVIT